MPTTYTGNPTATQAPGPQPRAGQLPAASLPVDGEAANAASIAQAHKEAMDYIAWLCRPTARSTQWTEATWKVGAPNGVNRFSIDHQGFPAWGQLTIRENWLTDESVGGSTSSGRFARLSVPWGWGVIGTSTILTKPPSSTTGQSLAFPTIWLPTDGTSGSTVSLQLNSNCPCFADTNNTIVMEWAACMDTTGANAVTWQMGLLSNTNTAKAMIQKANGDSNWQCITSDGTSTSTVDSGAAPGANIFQRFKIVYSGAAGDDSGVARCLFFIDGSLVANITTTLPATGLEPLFTGVMTSSTSARRLSVGPCWVTQNYGLLSQL